jgi:hypothetical protein
MEKLQKSPLWPALVQAKCPRCRKGDIFAHQLRYECSRNDLLVGGYICVDEKSKPVAIRQHHIICSCVDFSF